MILKKPRHEQFAQGIAAGKSQAEAYRDAGFSPNGARVSASRLCAIASVSARIEEIIAARNSVEQKALDRVIERTAITKERVLTELAKIGFANMADYTRLEGEERVVDLSETTLDQLAAVQEITTETIGKVRRTKLKLSDKRAALVEIGKEIGMFITRSEVGKPGDFANLSDDELIERTISELIAGGINEDAARTFVRNRFAGHEGKGSVH